MDDYNEDARAAAFVVAFALILAAWQLMLRGLID